MTNVFYLILSKIISATIILSRLFWIALIFSYIAPLAKLIQIDLTHNEVYTNLVYIRDQMMSPVHDLIIRITHQPLTILVASIVDIIILWIVLAIIDAILVKLQWSVKRRYLYASQRRQLEDIKQQNLKMGSNRSMIATTGAPPPGTNSATVTVDRQSTDHSMYMALEGKLEQLSKAKSKTETEEYYNEFMRMKKKLGSIARHFAFLSLDVVDSTGMKESEDKSYIQLDFIRFKKMVTNIVEDNGSVQSTWTPDGAMISFNTLDNAVVAAKEVYKELKRFNSQVKKINRDFIIRCGINAGIIYYDEKLSLDEITDVVIDIAGHLQKHADPGTIAITQASIMNLSDSNGFIKTTKVVDGFEVAQWTMQSGEEE